MMRYAITKNAVILSLFAISTAAALAITNELTIGKVECNKQAALMASLNEVMPHDRHDNDLLADRITVLRDGRRVWSGPKSEIDRSQLVEKMVEYLFRRKKMVEKNVAEKN